MKNLNIALLLLTVAMVWSCKKEYIQPNEFSDASVRHSKARDPLTTSINDVISFADLSQGVVTRQWTLAAGNEIIGSTDTVSQKETVNVRFKVPGDQKLRLVSTFKDSVTIIRKDGISSYRSLVLDTTFIIKVYDSLRVNFLVKVNNAFVQDSPVVVESGTFVTFTDTSSGIPDTYRWTLPGASTLNPITKETTVLYKKVGSYAVTDQVSRTAQFAPTGTKSLTRANFIKVVPTTKPVQLSLAELNDETSLKLTFNQELAATTPADYTVTVDGVNVPVVLSPFLNSSDSSVVKLTLAQKLYGGSVIKVVTSTNIKGRYGNLMPVAGTYQFFNNFNNLLTAAEAELEGATLPTTWNLQLTTGNVASLSAAAAYGGTKGITWTNPTVGNFIDLKSQGFNLGQNKKYKVTMFAKTTTSGVVKLAPSVRRVANGAVITTGDFTLTSDWQLYSFTTTTTDVNTATAAFFLRIVGNTANAVYLLDNLGIYEIAP